MEKVFFDASVFLRFLTGDDLEKQQAARAFFESVDRKTLYVKGFLTQFESKGKIRRKERQGNGFNEA